MIETNVTSNENRAKRKHLRGCAGPLIHKLYFVLHLCKQQMYRNELVSNSKLASLHHWMHQQSHFIYLFFQESKSDPAVTRHGRVRRWEKEREEGSNGGRVEWKGKKQEWEEKEK